MNELNIKPENILFTDKNDRKSNFQDVVADGLDGGYEDRIPAVITILTSGEPYYRLLSCVMLVSWGHKIGFRTLIDWASNPSSVPWFAQPVVYDRIYGSDSSFEMMADGLKTSFLSPNSHTIKKFQKDAARSLLSIYHQYFFDRTLALAIIEDDSLTSDLIEDICAAIETSMIVLGQSRIIEFNLAFQVASLLIPLARFDDHKAAVYADKLITDFAGDWKTLRELGYALAEGRGSETLASLHRLKTLDIPSLRSDIESALQRREES